MPFVTLLLSLVSRICEPEIKLGAHPASHSVIQRKTKAFFWVLFWMMILFPLSSPLSGMPYRVVLVMTVCHFFNFMAFILLCRSYLPAFYLYFTLVTAFAPTILMNIEKDSMFAYLGFSVTMPSLVFLITGNFYYVVVAETSQILTYLTVFKRIFKEVLLTTDIHAFTERFISTKVFGIAFMIFVFTIIFSMHQNKTKALLHETQAAQDALDHQKTFFFSFSHELRNPINSLLGNLQLLMMSTLTPEAKEMVRTAQICGELLLQMINNVLDAGKSNIGKLEISPTPTKVHDLFQRIWTITDEIITRKHLKSHLKVEKKLPPILMLDGHRLNQVMMNLIGNAVKFIDQGSISVTIKWSEAEDFGDQCFEPVPYDEDGLFEKEENVPLISMNRHTQQTKEHFVLNKLRKEFGLEETPIPTIKKKGVLKIIVKDTGCGMSPTALGRLFQKFSQVSESTQKRQISTGLRLFITREICQRANGDIRAYSKAGVGSTFIVCIPTSTASDYCPIDMDRSLFDIERKLSESRLKVIVADDSPFNVNLISKFFLKIKSQLVGTAKNGYTAYNMYKEKREAGIKIDIVTLDIDMPQMDGKTTCRKIREYEKTYGFSPAIIILISGNYDEEQLSKYLDKSHEKMADYFLKKPLIFEELCLALYRLTHKLQI